MAPTTPNAASQVATRSTSKLTGPITLDAFNKTMDENQKTQIETLNQCKLLLCGPGTYNNSP